MWDVAEMRLSAGLHENAKPPRLGRFGAGVEHSAPAGQFLSGKGSVKRGWRMRKRSGSQN